MQIVELNGSAEKQQRRLFAVVYGCKLTTGSPEIGEEQIGLVPILEGKFALHAFILRVSARRYAVGLAVPLKVLTLPNFVDARQRRRGLSGPREIVLELRVRKPAARSVVIDDVPLVPAALFVFVDDAADNDEAFVLVSAFGSDLQR